jgi:hypothetical protein
MYRCTLVNGLRRTGTLAASSWYIGKLRRAYGPQLILMDTRNETYKALQAENGNLSCLLHSQKRRQLAFAAEPGL